MSELVRHFGATFPNSLRLLALASAPPDAYAAEFRQAETSARQTLHTLAALPQDERSRRLRALFGGSIRLDLPAQRGLDHLARDPQLAQAVEVLQAILARPKS